MNQEPTLAEQMLKLSEIWQNLAQHSCDIAHARRTIFNAYVSDGFSEAQALELIKHI